MELVRMVNFRYIKKCTYINWSPKSDNGGTLINDDILKECQQAKE